MERAQRTSDSARNDLGSAVGRRSRLGIELEAAALRATIKEYDDANWSLFADELHRPEIEFGAGETQLGAWLAQRRTIVLSRSLLFGPWGSLTEVLKHEMAHQYVDEVLGAGHEPPHGKRFQSICAARGIDARAAGVPRQGTKEHPALERVAKLLALAESPNEHEAQAAMRAAQRLLLRHNLDADSALRDQGIAFRHLGTPTGRVREPARIVATILTNHFFVHAIWITVWRPLEGKSGRVLEICGRESNLQIAEYVHDFLHHTAAELWATYKRQQGIQRDRDRLAYLAGVMTGFMRRLGEERHEQTQAGLIYKGDAPANRYFRSRYPRTGAVRYQSSAGSKAHQAGHSAGRKLVLRKGISQSNDGTPRLGLPRGE